MMNIREFTAKLTRKHVAIGGVALSALIAGLAIAAPWEDTAKYGIMAADTDADGKITKAEMITQAATRFAARDKNKDGSLTSADRDIAEKQRLDAHFAEMDTDKNNNISRAEFDAGHGKTAAEKAGQPPKPRDGGPEDRGGMGGMGWSLAMGGRVAPDMTKAEFQAATLARFERVDANKDGVLDAAEMMAAKRDKRGRKGHGRGGPPGPPGWDHGPDHGPDGDMDDMSIMPMPTASPATAAPVGTSVAAPLTSPTAPATPQVPAQSQ